MTDLPGAVHLVAETEAPHAPWRLDPVLASKIAPLRAGGHVAVFDERGCFFRRARAEVEAEQRLRADGAAPRQKLVRPELIGLDRVPCTFEHRGARRRRADAGGPVVAGDEVAARVADDRHLERADFLEDVAAEAVLIGELRSGLEDPAVDGASEMLEERAEQAPIERGERAAGIHDDARERRRRLRERDVPKSRRPSERERGAPRGPDEGSARRRGHAGSPFYARGPLC